MTVTLGRDLWLTSTMVSMLQADGLLPDWEGVRCPRCHCGTLKQAAPQSVVACRSTDAAKPTSIHTMLIPSSSKALALQPRQLCSCFFSIVFHMLLFITFYISITRPLKIWRNAFANCVKPGWWNVKNPFALAQDRTARCGSR